MVKNINRPCFATMGAISMAMVLATLIASPGHGQNRLDNSLKLLLSQYEAMQGDEPRNGRKTGDPLHVVADSRQAANLSMNLRKGSVDLSNVRLPVLVKFAGEPDVLLSRGLQTQARSGEIFTGLVDLAALGEVSRTPGVQFIQLNKILRSVGNQTPRNLTVLASRALTGNSTSRKLHNR